MLSREAAHREAVAIFLSTLAQELASQSGPSGGPAAGDDGEECDVGYLAPRGQNNNEFKKTIENLCPSLDDDFAMRQHGKKIMPDAVRNDKLTMWEQFILLCFMDRYGYPGDTDEHRLAPDTVLDLCGRYLQKCDERLKETPANHRAGERVAKAHLFLQRIKTLDRESKRTFRDTMWDSSNRAIFLNVLPYNLERVRLACHISPEDWDQTVDAAICEAGRVACNAPQAGKTNAVGGKMIGIMRFNLDKLANGPKYRGSNFAQAFQIVGRTWCLINGIRIRFQKDGVSTMRRPQQSSALSRPSDHGALSSAAPMFSSPAAAHASHAHGDHSGGYAAAHSSDGPAHDHAAAHTTGHGAQAGGDVSPLSGLLAGDDAPNFDISENLWGDD